jgi:putative alpha-1,2-mannosidase
MQESKRTAQQFNYYAKRLAKTQAQEEMYLAINTKLTRYKYDKTSKQLPIELQKEIHFFLQKIRRENV